VVVVGSAAGSGWFLGLTLTLALARLRCRFPLVPAFLRRTNLSARRNASVVALHRRRLYG
jgi:hypothetical protein